MTWFDGYYALKLEAPEASDDQIREEAKNLLHSFFAENCDEDTLSQPLYLVTKADRIVVFPENGTEANFPILWTAGQLPPTFQQVWDASLEAVAKDVLSSELLPQFAELPRDSRPDYIRRQGAARLARSYAAAAEEFATAETAAEPSECAVTYSFFVESMLDRTAPFVIPFAGRSPHEYPAYYSSWVDEDGPNAILIIRFSR